jgi:hypothetical protein
MRFSTVPPVAIPICSARYSLPSAPWRGSLGRLKQSLSQISGVDGSSGMTANFALRHFEASLILQAVCWYLRYPGFRDRLFHNTR